MSDEQTHASEDYDPSYAGYDWEGPDGLAGLVHKVEGKLRDRIKDIRKVNGLSVAATFMALTYPLLFELSAICRRAEHEKSDGNGMSEYRRVIAISCQIHRLHEAIRGRPDLIDVDGTDARRNAGDRPSGG